ncbi:uncharacterized protein Z519_07145 [Cladophialophora bantiana CBS 173.52]|uniref:Uncharacterized protein n=1 Tax=Cladophialophora bantiana (strain ATCC 10958 / CBS 173.52 / CDC B-1940 / NIH 8579) TaxID=1442370 RepID=A0A0D2EQD4_CLAB1|nr:uncharacterized protein Z519_07145 [Cladophialophora bantiana CBS 173.52]KIW92161.1 hypothetical protein Z519_07145 [Cladophialophora bantiana CBS 173.52]
MTSTPPLQIASTPQTPPTPLHGPAYDRSHSYPNRRSTRTSSRIASSNLHSTPDGHQKEIEDAVTTPRPSRQPRSKAAPGIQSPELTPKHKAPRRVQVTSPPSPDNDNLPPTTNKPPPSKSHLQPMASSSTTISDGMLPTPVKTPRKKMVPKASKAARALFQDTTTSSNKLAEFEPSPRRDRRNKRYNGFSLESFSAENDDSRGQVQIYTDSRDRVPHVDNSESNPFLDRMMNGETSSTRKIAGTSKRRKVSGESKKVDPQVEEALQKDDGMVYVFRGKKVYRRFDDDEDEDEEIDAGDLGLLEHTPKGSNVKRLRTLTRRSVKPKRLFQTEAQQKAREAEQEEEALTDIEEPTRGKGHSSAATGDNGSIDISPNPVTRRSLRSSGPAPPILEEADSLGPSRRSTQKASPFDSWPRLKSGGRSVAGTPKGKKRSAADAVDDGVGVLGVESKKSKA